MTTVDLLKKAKAAIHDLALGEYGDMAPEHSSLLSEIASKIAALESVDAARLAGIRSREEAATSGPWRWNLSRKSKRIVMESTVRGYEIVMDFVRWGMGGARPRFRDNNGLMENADAFSAVVPGREHHEDWFRTLKQADADFISHSREDVAWLLEEMDRLR